MAKLQKLTISLITSAMVVLAPVESNAQLLKKLGDSVKKAGKEFLKNETNKTSETKTVSPRNNATQNSASTTRQAPTASSSNADFIVPPYYTLTITPETKWVNTKGEVSSVYLTDVHDGIWGCMLNYGWGFYRIDGTKVFDYIWEETIGREQPCFSNGALLMFKKGESGDNRHLYILYTDGRVKSLPKKYVSATNFVDGIAMVGLSNGGYAFLNTDGNEVYPNVKAIPWYFQNPERRIAPLSDGLRLYRDASTNLWGYFDANGKIVIPPAFTEARSFSEGLALVTDQKQNIYFIDKTGKKAFEPQWDLTNLYMNKITDFNEGYCVQLDVDDRSLYFDKTGKEVGAYYVGTPFVDGYAWFRPTSGIGGPFRVMNKNFEASKPQFNLEIVDYHVEHPDPDYSEAGVAVCNSKTVIKPNGDIVISGEMGREYKYLRPYDIGKFSPDNYAKASLSVNNGERLEGFINMKGEFVLIYKWDVRSIKEIQSRYLAPGATPPLKESDYIEATIPINICDMTPLGPK